MFVPSTKTQTSVTELELGISIQGNVQHGEYRYFKFSFSYNDTSTQSPSRSPITNVSNISRSKKADTNDPEQITSNKRFPSLAGKTTSSGLLSVPDPFDPQDPHKNSITFDLHSTSGDSDLFISCILEESQGTYLTPSNVQGHYNFSSQHSNEDILSISAGDTKNCARHGESGTFYIAVYGSSYGASEFVLTVNMYGGVRTMVNGLTIYGNVLVGLGTLFRYQLPDKNAMPIHLSMDVTAGDADLYVKLGVDKSHDVNDARIFAFSERAVSSSNESPYDPARKDHYDFKSAHASLGQEYIQIDESDMAACAAAACWVSILVAGYETSSYSLSLVAGDATVLLSNGVPQHSSVAKVNHEVYATHTVSAIYL